MSRHLDSPLEALHEFLERLVRNPQVLYELVREVDVKWGQLSGERPFQRLGETRNPDDPYTHESVQQQLARLLDSLSHR